MPITYVIRIRADANGGLSQSTPSEKARLFLKASAIVKRRRNEIAEVLARETGSTISFATFQQDLVAATLQQVAGWVFLPKGEGSGNKFARHPLDRGAASARSSRQLHPLERRERAVLASRDFANEETFGPVVVVEVVDTPEDAIAAANRTMYGLTSSILAGNTYRAFDMAPKVLAGIVNVN